MKRIKYIADLIKKGSNYIMDVGSDHAYLSIELLKNNKCNFVYNIEVNKGPLEQGIRNLAKCNLLNKTNNILNNGLKGLEDKINVEIDYLVIAGMGSNTIINILSNNKLKIKNYLLQTNKNEYALRKWLLTNGYSIVQEHIIFERNIYYVLLEVVKKKNYKLYSKKNLKFGKLNMVVDMALYIDYLKDRRKYIANQNLPSKAKEIKLLDKMVKKYEGNRNI